MLHAREGDKVLIVKNSYPESGLWNNAGMVATIGQFGIIREISSDYAEQDYSYLVNFDDPNINNSGEGWYYHEDDFELIVSDTLINF